MSVAKKKKMSPFLSAVVALMLVGFGWGTAHGVPLNRKVSETCSLVDETNEAMGTLQKERARFLGWLKKLRKMATKLQKQPAGPARDYRLRTVMAEARTLASKLARLDKRLARLRKRARTLAKQLREVASKIAKQGRGGASLQKKLRGCLKRAQGLSPKPRKATGKLAKVTLDPRDGPREIRRKADLLADSADKLDRRLKRLERSIKHLRKQVALRKAVKRADGRDRLWGGDSRRRVAVRVNKAPGVKGVVDQDDGTDSPNSLTGWENGQEGYDSHGNGVPADPSASTERNTTTPSVTLQRVWNTTVKAIRDLVGSETARKMNKAFRAGDRRARLKALRRAQKLLKKNAQALRSKSKAYRKKARIIEKRSRARKSR